MEMCIHHAGTGNAKLGRFQGMIDFHLVTFYFLHGLVVIFGAAFMNGAPYHKRALTPQFAGELGRCSRYKYHATWPTSLCGVYMCVCVCVC